MSNTRKKSPALRAVAKPVLVVGIFLAIATPIHACPMCKDSCPVDPAAKTTAAADQGGLSFNKSIYFMLGGLASVAGSTGRVMYKATKRSAV